MVIKRAVLVVPRELVAALEGSRMKRGMKKSDLRNQTGIFLFVTKTQLTFCE